MRRHQATKTIGSKGVDRYRDHPWRKLTRKTDERPQVGRHKGGH